ncbi:MAG: hypothetical protein BWY55_00252 [archaeon ADurb.Bin336]|nr:MAG: hypothetical protein BWY55_00252 [archaeon ADurb.Bin336]
MRVLKKLSNFLIKSWRRIRNFFKGVLQKIGLLEFVKSMKYKYYDFSIGINYRGQEASDKIYSSLISDKPVMICRMGNTETSKLKEMSLVLDNKLEYDNERFDILRVYSGFFPVNFKNMKRFYERMMCDIKLIDIMGCWSPEELFFKKQLTHVTKIPLIDLESWYHDYPWSKALEGKKILVIHPFEKTIKSQYKKRSKLFENKDVLPKFNLKTLKAVQSLGGNSDKFSNWFEALEYMENEISKIDFDIAIIGCGAYGLPLAAHVKRMGKKVVHMGGATQLLFGIKGKRWEDSNFKFFNKYWVRPLEEEKPKDHEKVEDSCYW